jgi:hypothetical protein
MGMLSSVRKCMVFVFGNANGCACWRLVEALAVLAWLDAASAPHPLVALAELLPQHMCCYGHTLSLSVAGDSDAADG